MRGLSVFQSTRSFDEGTGNTIFEECLVQLCTKLQWCGSNENNGDQAKVTAMNVNTQYTHFYAHQLNLTTEHTAT